MAKSYKKNKKRYKEGDSVASSKNKKASRNAKNILKQVVNNNTDAYNDDLYI